MPPEYIIVVALVEALRWPWPPTLTPIVAGDEDADTDGDADADEDADRDALLRELDTEDLPVEYDPGENGRCVRTPGPR